MLQGVSRDDEFDFGGEREPESATTLAGQPDFAVDLSTNTRSIFPSLSTTEKDT